MIPPGTWLVLAPPRSLFDDPWSSTHSILTPVTGRWAFLRPGMDPKGVQGSGRPPGAELGPAETRRDPQAECPSWSLGAAGRLQDQTWGGAAPQARILCRWCELYHRRETRLGNSGWTKCSSFSAGRAVPCQCTL